MYILLKSDWIQTCKQTEKYKLFMSLFICLKNNISLRFQCQIGHLSVKGYDDMAIRDRITNTAVLEKAQLPSLCSLLRQCRLQWLGQVCWMDDGWIPKDILYAELTSGKRQIGRPQMRFKDVCKNDLRCFGIVPSSWENLAQDRPRWGKAL